MRDPKNIAILVLFIISSALAYFIFKPSKINCKKCQEKCYTDSTHVTERTVTVFDTIPFKQTKPNILELEITPPVAISPADTTLPSVSCDSVRKYVLNISDSLLTGDAEIDVQGVLLHYKFTYIQKFPRTVIRRDIVYKEKTTYKLPKQPKWILLGGMELGGNANMFQYSPKVSLLTEEDWVYHVRYEFNGVMGNSLNFGLSIPLYRQY